MLIFPSLPAHYIPAMGKEVSDVGMT